MEDGVKIEDGNGAELVVNLCSLLNLVFLFNEIQNLEKEKNDLLAKIYELDENLDGNEFALSMKKEEDKNKSSLSEKRQNIVDLKKQIEKKLLIVEDYIKNSRPFGIRHDQNGEWIHPFTYLDNWELYPVQERTFSPSRTYAEAKVFTLIIESLELAVKLSGEMRKTLLEEMGQITGSSGGIFELIAKLQTKALMLYELSSLCERAGQTILEHMISEYAFWESDEIRFIMMKLGIVKKNEIKQKVIDYVLERVYETDNSQIAKNAVRNAYLFQCLEWELLFKSFNVKMAS